jgi:hypothetical protein
MSQWLSHEMAQGLAFNAGSNFDPPKEVKGYYLQPDLSLGVGSMPFDKRNFPTITVPALADYGAANLFPSSVLFPNLSVHLRMGLPWRGDFYIRLADATTPPGYKISPTMTAKVQTNSIGFGIRQHILGGDLPVVTLGAHYNHVQGSTHLKGKFNVNVDAAGQTIFTANDDFTGDIAWSVNSFGLTAVAAQTYGAWTPFLGVGYNYTTGSVRTKLNLQSSTFLVSDITGEGSDRPEKSQGREIFGVSYDRPTWSLFANGELKALGQLQYRSYIIQFGGALPFDIGRGPAIFYKSRPRGSATTKSFVSDDEETPVRAPKPRKAPAREPQPSSSLIYLK